MDGKGHLQIQEFITANEKLNWAYNISTTDINVHVSKYQYTHKPSLEQQLQKVSYRKTWDAKFDSLHLDWAQL